jgi:hypothetical protein
MSYELTRYELYLISWWDIREFVASIPINPKGIPLTPYFWLTKKFHKRSISLSAMQAIFGEPWIGFHKNGARL